MDLAKWVGALCSLVGFALAMGVNPALYGATADLLARGERVAARLGWMIAGLMAGATLLFLLMQVFDPTHYVAALRGDLSRAVLDRWVDLIAGVVFLLSATGVVWWRAARPRLPEASSKPVQAHASAIGYFGIGIGSAVIGLTTWPLMYLVARLVASVGGDWALRGAAYAVFLVALGAPFALLAVAWSRFPATTARITAFYTRALQADYRWPLAALLAASGVVFLALSFFAHR